MTQHTDTEIEAETAPRSGRVIMVPLSAAFGIVITMLVAVVTGTWWASDISTKLAYVMKQIDQREIATTAISVRLVALEVWKQGVDGTGTLAAKNRLDEQAKEINDLRRQVDIFLATDNKQNKKQP